MPHELINAQLPGRREGEERWWKGDTGVVELGGFGGSREAGWGVLMDLKESLGWSGHGEAPDGTDPKLIGWNVPSASRAHLAPSSIGFGVSMPVPLV